MGTEESYSFNEMIDPIDDKPGTIVESKCIGNPLDEYVDDTVADYSKIHEVTGWEPQIGFEESVSRVYKPYE